MALIPTGLSQFPFSILASELQQSPGGEFHLHPHYRTPRPLDALLLKTKAGSDEFITEKYADALDMIFKRWSASLRNSPQNMQSIQDALSPGFSGTSLAPTQSRTVRSGPIEIRQNTFPQESVLTRDAFVRDLRSAWSSFTRILTAEFQTTRIDAGPSPMRPRQLPAQLKTRVRYELVGTGRDFYREQRVGNWELTWEPTSAGEFRLRSCRALSETQSRAATPLYQEITAAVLGGNASYAAQLLHGTDYWRTVLDGACGIDIYGHDGVSMGDIDGDGLDDLYVCQPGGLPNRLYRNRGDGSFEDITEAAGVGVLENTACALIVDVDNDGRQDLIVVRANGPLLFLNQGGGKFRQKPDAFQFANPPQGTFTGAAVADYDRDGWLDIYFCLYAYYQGTDQYKYPSPYYAAENGPPNFLMRNQRDGTFHDVTRATGLDKNNTRYSFCCGWSDFNNDGWPDLYVVNDFGRKNLYRNNGDGTFTDTATQAGVEDIGAGMSVCCFDYDNDGADDLYVANMWTAAGERITTQDTFKKDSPKEVRAAYHKHAMGNSLYHNQTSSSVILSGVESSRSELSTESKDPYPPSGSLIPTQFQDATLTSGASNGRWAWSSDAFDFDHDGFPDLYIANGMVSGPAREDLNSFFWRQVVEYSPDQAKPSHEYEQGWAAINELIRSDCTWSGYERNVFYANNGDGTFSDISGAIGLDFLEDGRSFALADFDGDGRQELFLKNRNGPQLRILKNVMPDLPPAIAFRLRGTKSNHDAVGAAVTVETGAGRQTRRLQAGSGFLSQHSKELFFGLGKAKGPVRASIRWPSGAVQELRDLPINHRIWVAEGSPRSRIEPFKIQTAVPQGLKPNSFVPPDGAAKQAAEKVESLTSAAKAAEENTAVIAALKRCATQNQGFSAAGTAVPFPETATVPTSISQLRVGATKKSGEEAAVTGNADSAESLQERHEVELIGKVETWLLAPVSAPDFSLPDLAGRRCTLSALRGKPVLLNFWNQQAPPCRVDLETFSRFYGRWSAKGLELVTVNVEDAPDSLSSLAREHRYPFPILRASEEAAALYNILCRQLFDRHRDLSLPTSFLIDPQGEIVKVYQGSLDPEHVEHDWQHIPRTTAERLAAALPFPGITEVVEFGRNYLSLGALFFQRGYLDQAEASFRVALRDDPSSAEALYGIGSVCLNQQRNAEAREFFARAVKLTATYPDTLPNSWNNLGILATREGRMDEAIGYFQEALRLSPDSMIALDNLGSAYRQTRRWSEAQAIYERALRTKPEDAEANYGLGMVYAQNDDTARAEDYLQRALKLRPAYPEALNNLGILYLRTQRRDQGVASFEESIRVAPDFDQSYLNLARVYVIEGDKDQARAVLSELLKRHPDHRAAKEMLEELR